MLTCGPCGAAASVSAGISVEELEDRFFIRVKKDTDIMSAVPCECEITIPEAEDEKAVITKNITGTELAGLIQAIDGVIGCIKVR